MKSKSIFGFTLIEIVLVVFIIAFLGSLAFVSTKSILNKSKENQKIDDIKTLQTALDLYKSNEGFYPASEVVVAGQPLISSDGTKTYLKKIPNPISDNINDTYQYHQSQNGSSYKINYKINSKLNNNEPGNYLAIPATPIKPCFPAVAPVTVTLSRSAVDKINISWSSVPGATQYKVYGNTNNSNNVLTTTTSLSYDNGLLTKNVTYYYTVSAIVCDVESTKTVQQSMSAGTPTPCNGIARATECNIAVNNKGDACGGGTLFCEGETNCGGANLVASPSGCSSTTSCNCGNDSIKKRWRTTSTLAESPYTAVSSSIGYNNMNGNIPPTKEDYNPSSEYEAAKFCADLNINGFDDWYLPSQYELCAMSRSSSYCSGTGTRYYCVAGVNEVSAKTPLNGCTNSAPFVPTLYSVGGYWSSTESNATQAWWNDAYYNDIVYAGTKGDAHYVRCVRRF